MDKLKINVGYSTHAIGRVSSSAYRLVVVKISVVRINICNAKSA